MYPDRSFPDLHPAPDRTCSVRRSAGRSTKIRALFVFLVALTSFVVYSSSALADSPPNITADILWTDTGGVFDPDRGIYHATFDGVIDVEAAYNNARRQEEAQLGLSSGALGNLDLPTQATWDMYNDDQRVTIILNAERVARSAMRPGVLGLPVTAIQVDVDNMAQGHANYLLSANRTGHIDGAGNSPFDRIDSDPMLGPCHEFLNRAENISYYWTSGSSNPLYIERSIYGWIYDDSGSSWGHREAALLQDKDLATQNATYGFNNNVGSTVDEGYIGIGVAQSATYNPYGWGWVNWGTIVVFNVIDPISTGSCPWDKVAPVCYSLTLSHEGSGSDPVATPANSAGCGPGKYYAGERVSLSSAPELGWAVAGWSGTNDDGSMSASNSLTMPAGDHVAAIRYAYEPVSVCYSLALAHEGNGSDPDAVPDNSAGCAIGKYTAGDSVLLSATPEFGWAVAHWAGTNDDSSTSTINSLTMPDGDHTVGIRYVPASGQLFEYIYLPLVQ